MSRTDEKAQKKSSLWCVTFLRECHGWKGLPNRRDFCLVVYHGIHMIVSVYNLVYHGMTGLPEGAADTRYLQRELGQVLPVALAAIAELQPSDPVTVLAHWLYRYRELNPLPTRPATTSSVVEDCASANNPSSMGTAVMAKEPAEVPSLPCQPPRAVSVQIVQNDDNDDFIEDSGYLGSVHLETPVHCEIVLMLSNIGDLFDDDDLG